MALPDFDTERELALFGVFDGHGGAAVQQAHVDACCHCFSIM